jgi:hypothetical protein
LGRDRDLPGLKRRRLLSIPEAADYRFDSVPAEIYLATSCFMDYGLFDQAVLTLADAKERLGGLICSDTTARMEC